MIEKKQPKVFSKISGIQIVQIKPNIHLYS